LVVTDLTRAAAAHPVLIDVDTLRARLAKDGPHSPSLRVVDLRWAPSGLSGRQRYDAAHIPGAVFADLDRDLSHAQPRGSGGRHPMTSADELAHAIARFGIGEETDVIVYDDGSGQIAARLWFQLRLHGHDKVSLLDGGLWAWQQAGLATESAEGKAPTAPLRRLERKHAWLVDRLRIEEVIRSRKAAPSKAPLLLDARAPERYRGEVEPLDRVPGHIPTAVNLPGGKLVRGANDPRWRSPDEVRAQLAEAGVTGSEREVIASCGSGVTACHLLAAMEYAGVTGPNTRLYGGSYSDWVSDANAEIHTGSEP
jgi:thiosulfate/3-mercaptopyruvate sulfurtransferase